MINEYEIEDILKILYEYINNINIQKETITNNNYIYYQSLYNVINYIINKYNNNIVSNVNDTILNYFENEKTGFNHFIKKLNNYLNNFITNNNYNILRFDINKINNKLNVISSNNYNINYNLFYYLHINNINDLAITLNLKIILIDIINNINNNNNFDFNELMY